MLVLAIAALGGPAQAQSASPSELISRLAGADFGETERIVEALAATGDPAVAPVLEALGEGDLYFRRADNAVFIARRGGAGYLLTDPLTGADVGEAGRREVDQGAGEQQPPPGRAVGHRHAHPSEPRRGRASRPPPRRF
ncbi:MAG: hypothetical protein ACMVO3_14065 [Thalassobaculum sp.]